MKPTLIVTRPDPQGPLFAATIRQAWPGPLDVILSPLLRIVPVPVADNLTRIGGVIFTSVNGVAQAARLGLPKGCLAFCVGAQTQKAAADVGFETVTGPGNATELTALILRRGAIGPLAHIRGHHARGDIAATLTSAGVACRDVIAYDQQAQSLHTAAKTALDGIGPVVVPLFSARTSTIFQQQGPFAAPLHLIAISAAAVPSDMTVRTIAIATAPNGPAMVAATIACLRDLAQQG
ncbi:uroporphyrinogen-III synthase [Yoonia sp.]|uniref:uroporphyrinogen-III synthase n=1 Tax=Yoonia sp. TaxID=2212373 RepID=UPI0019EB875D|nr:uroporphyrinogen-III synthase [Yoonia sp.]MBE0413895.1 uroporphyrinogen-III synthase [Yoonia sp.]